MSRVMRVLTDLGPCTSPSEFYAAAAARMPSDVLFALGPGACRELRRELHSIEAIAEWAVAVAVQCDRVILLNFEFNDGSSRTFTLSPPGWTQERLLGFIAGRHAEIEEAFGPIAELSGPQK